MEVDQQIAIVKNNIRLLSNDHAKYVAQHTAAAKKCEAAQAQLTETARLFAKTNYTIFLKIYHKN